MSMRYKGGVISATPPTTSTSAATGVWSQQAIMQAVAAGTWPRIPGAPTIGTATAGSESATVPFTAPTDLGAGSITYTATSSPGSITGTGTSPITVSGLTNGTAYTFIVRGATPGGTGPASASSNSVTPVAPYWIGLLGPAQGYAIAVDSSGNVYLSGKSSTITIGNDDFQVAKYNNSGVIQWQRILGDTSTVNDICYSVAVDSSGNVYLCGLTYTSGITNEIEIAKYNTSGTIQWQKSLISGNGGAAYGVAVDASGNVYICGYSSIPSGNPLDNGLQIVKYNTSGTIQWQRILSGGSNDASGYSISIDSSGNIYVCGYLNTSSNLDFLIAKYNNSGTIQWQRKLGGSSYDFGYSVAVDSSGNVYVFGQSDASGTNDFQIAKYDTSGTIQWQRRLGGSSDDIGRSVAVDSSGNVYVCGYSNASGNYDLQIAKYNTSGTIQWQRRLGSSVSDFGYSIATDSSGNMYICGFSQAGGANNFLFAKLPGDGSLTGTYTVGGYSFTYAASSLSDAVSSLTDAATSLTASTSTRTDAATSLTSATSTLTSSVTTI